MGTFFQAFYQADAFGKMIFFALFALSVISWFFLIHKIWTFNQVKRQSKIFKQAITLQKDSLLNIKVEPVKQKRHIPEPFHKLYRTIQQNTVAILDKNHFYLSGNQNFLSRTDVELIDSHLQSSIAKEREDLEKNLFILSTTVTLAPFLGLLGTVWGILITFGELQAGHSVSSNSIILGGLSTALTTTVLGLLIAIPALIAYNYLKNLSSHFTTEMRDFSHFLLSTVELQYRKVDIE
ncbi:MAG: MotA/TolQ/ExbB proton channel family protein [Simkania sp.]|uniref:Putative TolQ protein n=1 Tax=Simkania negevensis (strain ATCC VR-1471 / DSM 27360 / Z) TaxID=331113 RepID=F8L5B7_SIMNZ|nr:MotA/TolQ/ExbB proton channel family protein [Simkania negevensis]MCB1066927.1 MotA/TolQ/ExbB proton channel family protein [Simkania sp.]MCB1074701.1 MotA/TolQ/ExbB proton channel family protein [Simkania sp.]MCB1084073.1 MotA/TolQ/ExbB proton channel family protein [Simkania sp.]CCB88006.1 putative TolQ protein [Simkania negevensis Z]